MLYSFQVIAWHYRAEGEETFKEKLNVAGRAGWSIVSTEHVPDKDAIYAIMQRGEEV